MTRRFPAVCAAAGVGISLASFVLSQGSGPWGGRWWMASLGLALGTGGAAGWWGGRWVTARLDPLVHVASGLAQGRPTRVPWDESTRGPDEFAALASALTDLAEHAERRGAASAEDRTQFGAVLSGMVEGVLVLDRKGRILLLNPAMERILGCRQEEVIGHRWIEVVRQHDLNELIRSVLSRRESLTAEVVLDERAGAPSGRRDARTFAVQGSVARRPDGEEEDIRSVFVFHDVSELKRLERVRSDFIANASHELRTPLTSVLGYLEALLDGAENNPGERHDFLRVMKTHADRLNALIHDLLQLSQIESGEYRWRREPVNVADLIRRSIELVAPLATRKGVAVEIGAGPTDLSLVADAEKLSQVLLNLLDNAVKYTEAGGRVDVETAMGADRLVIRVRDTGIGIPPGERERIFERFYRVDRARSRELGGTGLGLSIVKHIVDAHGGAVTVDSRLGAGSMFTVSLPLNQERA